MSIAKNVGWGVRLSPWRAELIVGVLALLGLVLWDVSGWDLALTRRFGNAAGFEWRQAWVTRSLLHDGGRWLSGAVLALLVLDTLRPLASGPSRRERGYWLGVVLLSLLVVPTLKRFSLTSCPWDLAEFGGTARYVPHWLLGVSDGGAGHCFPSGHAVAAYAFFGVYFLWRPYRPRGALAMLGLLMAAGAAFGWAQLVRGAHFASHTLWSAWICWALALLAVALAPRLGRAPVHAAAAPSTAG